MRGEQHALALKKYPLKAGSQGGSCVKKGLKHSTCLNPFIVQRMALCFLFKSVSAFAAEHIVCSDMSVARRAAG